jgi:uncharacterized protein (TIGR02145 family)
MFNWLKNRSTKLIFPILSGLLVAGTVIAAEMYYDLDIAEIVVNESQRFVGALSITGDTTLTGDFTANTDQFFIDSSTGSVGIGTTGHSGSKFIINIKNSQAEDTFADEGKIATNIQGDISGGSLRIREIEQAFVCGNTLIGQDGLTYGTVLAGDGNCWFDRNIGATRVAVAYNDVDSYGHLFQWGRNDDGHEFVTSGTTATLSMSDTPPHSNFILSSVSPFDWRSPQNDNLWQGVNGVNNVCPAGFRIPTEYEWGALVTAESITNRATAFSSTLALPSAGYRLLGSGTLLNLGSSGSYWSSSVSETFARTLTFYLGSVDPVHLNNRAFGFSVRCVMD